MKRLKGVVKMESEGCTVCDEKNFKDIDGKYKMRLENSNWDHYNDCFDYDDIEINYCYQCGKKFV